MGRSVFSPVTMRTFQGDSLTLVKAMSWSASPLVCITLQSVCSNVLLAKDTKFALIPWWQGKFSLNSDDIVLPTNKTSWEVCFSARLRCFISFVAGFPSWLAKTAVAFRYRAQKKGSTMFCYFTILYLFSRWCNWERRLHQRRAVYFQ